METALNTTAPVSQISSPFAGLRARYEQFKLYHRSIHELSALSDHALADLGLTRGMIKSVAREAAYGA